LSGFNFNVFVPFNKVEKSINNDVSKSRNGNYLVAGYASTGDRDLDGETIDPEGIDYNYLVGPNGFIDYEHDQDEVIGFPTENTHVDENGLYVEAELFGNDPKVKKIIKLYNNLKKSNANKTIGFSIEGIARERDANDKNTIRQVDVTGVAVTKHPANPEATWDLLQKSLYSDKYRHTWDSINKSETMEAGTGISPATQLNGAALRPEAFADHIKNVTYTLNQYKESGMLKEFLAKVADLLDSDSNSDLDMKSAFLQVATGVSKQDALTVLGNRKSDLTALHRALNGNDASQSADSDDDDDSD